MKPFCSRLSVRFFIIDRFILPQKCCKWLEINGEPFSTCVRSDEPFPLLLADGEFLKYRKKNGLNVFSGLGILKNIVQTCSSSLKIELRLNVLVI